MVKNASLMPAALACAALVGTLACSNGDKAAPAAPLNCERGTHQQGDKCVLNEPVPAPAPTPAPAAR
jgi:hypothetical protein